jgi:electron transfer flavoprotein alpha subunit
MAILIIAEHDHASLSDQTAKAVSAATQIGSDIHVLVAGKDAKAAADAAAKLDGVSKVLHAEGDEYANRLAEPLAALVVSLAGRIRHADGACHDVGQERHAAGRSPS